jgi:hypothetical protein
MIHTQIAPTEQADRLAIRELADAYAHCADFNGQSTVALYGDRATGESYCIAHHLFTQGGERKLNGRMASVRRPVRQGRRRLALRRAQPLCRLDRDPAFASLAARPCSVWILEGRGTGRDRTRFDAAQRDNGGSGGEACRAVHEEHG